MPLVVINWVVIDPVRRAKSQSPVCAAYEHYIRAIVGAEWFHRSHHVNVVVSRAVNGDKDLPGEPSRIDRTAKNQAATHVDCRNLIESWCDIRVLGVTRTNAPKAAATIPTTNKKITVAGHVESSPLRRIGNTDWTLPGRSGISGPTESAEITSEKLSPKLVLEAVSHAGRGSIDSEPFLVAAMRASIG